MSGLYDCLACGGWVRTNEIGEHFIEDDSRFEGPFCQDCLDENTNAELIQIARKQYDD